MAKEAKETICVVEIRLKPEIVDLLERFIESVEKLKDGVEIQGAIAVDAPVVKPGPSTITREELLTGFKSLLKEKGKEACSKILEAYGVEKLVDLKPEQFGDVAIDLGLV